MPVSHLDYDILNAAFDSIDVGIMIHDDNNSILVFNNAMTQITGFLNHEAIGKDCRSIIKPSFCDKSCALCSNAENRRKKVYYDLQIDNKQGGSRWVRINSFKFSRSGANFYLVTITDIAEMKQFEESLNRFDSFYGIVGKNHAMNMVFEFIRSIAETDLTVLITGETGTGKELVASAIQQHSLRKSGPFIKVNCAALPEHLIESELFGHVKGAYTGAITDRIGRFEAASGGTIFLDEIGEVSLKFQAKLLRVLQEREIERIGENKPRRIDVRILTATNKDLSIEVSNGNFREDLYYRLAVAAVNLPGLRERTEDIPLLALHFFKQFCLKYSRNIQDISAEMMHALMKYHWPGNIRELYNFMEVAVVTCVGNTLDFENIQAGRIKNLASDGIASFAENPSALSTLTEKERIAETLMANRHNISLSAQSLGISRTTLWRKMKALDLGRTR